MRRVNVTLTHRGPLLSTVRIDEAIECTFRNASIDAAEMKLRVMNDRFEVSAPCSR